MPRMGRNAAKAGLIAALDIGTAKIACLVATLDAEGRPVFAGIGHQRSRGLKSGVVVDAEEAERAVRAAIGQAERMAGVTLDRVTLALGCGRIGSTRFVARATLETGIVRPGDLERVLAGGEAYLKRDGRTLVHVDHSDWKLDQTAGVRNPVGMAARELAVELGAVTADEGPVRNLAAIIERCHVTVGAFTATPVASAHAVTTIEERRLGALVVDIGAGMTCLARFVDGRLEQVEAIPVGGNHVTSDLAKGLGTSLTEAERIKTLYGTLVKATSDDSELISYPAIGQEDEPTVAQTSRARIRELIGPRIAQVFDLVAERLSAGRTLMPDPGFVVLTGGTSQLIGIEGAWMQRFGGVARVGRTRPIGRMPANMSSPAFATVIGLVAAGRSDAGSGTEHLRRRADDTGRFGRVQRWLRESF